MAGIRGSLDREGKHPRRDFDTGCDANSRKLILEEEAWSVLQINANASFALQRALETGDAEHGPLAAPLAAVALYVASARNDALDNRASYYGCCQSNTRSSSALHRLPRS
jgi:hypothetical protein